MTPEIAIGHEAIVRRVDTSGGLLEVVVADADADGCAGCAAAALCRNKGGGEILVSVADATRFKPGDRVRIAADSRMHRRSVWLMLGLPCLMLVVPIVALCMAGCPEWVAFLAGISACVITYSVLYYMRRRFAGNLIFRIAD